LIGDSLFVRDVLRSDQSAIQHYIGWKEELRNAI